MKTLREKLSKEAWYEDKQDGFITFVTDELIELINKELVNEVIKLSDKIELEHDTSLEEWKAFKHFRNTLRDKYEK